ncbi:hypothetical protein [Clostridium ganghwense]|uniref:Uncharacterized protein n=1 Tax=Clostridium ganghwense TaxID=312089 RepID=A0ABT4CWZ5_9CLOT|nr:hypothetical protein [Clostridium ganghwense]MCY6372419.1 hypothetical protein [Clostridium ganghwense]
MGELKLTVTQAKREETIEKILKLVETEFEEVEVTVLFTKGLLEDAIRKVEERALLAPLKIINKN